MPLSQNQQTLIHEVENTLPLGGTFRSIKCVNATQDQRRGVLSLVFKAVDSRSGDEVALKFFDPDRLHNLYRSACFRREPEMLQELVGHRRALQLVAGLETFNIDMTGANGHQLTVPYQYFVTEWIDSEIDPFFFDSSEYPVEEKLRLFRSIVLAVQTLHTKGLFHRDLKIDNIRLRAEKPDFLTVVIDFGTAATLSSPRAPSEYELPVGANAFAPIECFLGFSGDRELCQKSDIYALGTLFFDLFECSQFAFRRQQETFFDQAIAAIGVKLQDVEDQAKRLRILENSLNDFRYQGLAPELDHVSNSVPAPIRQLSDKLYSELTSPFYGNRIGDFQKIIRRIDTMIAVLNHERRYQEKIEARRKARLELDPSHSR